MLKISYEIDKVRWIQELQIAGVTDVNKLEQFVSRMKNEVSQAFEAGRDFQRRYAEDEE